jgi:hypothetical protein
MKGTDTIRGQPHLVISRQVTIDAALDLFLLSAHMNRFTDLHRAVDKDFDITLIIENIALSMPSANLNRMKTLEIFFDYI